MDYDYTLGDNEMAKQKAIRSVLTTEDILILQQEAVRTGYDYGEVRALLVRIANPKLWKLCYRIYPTDSLILFIDEIVLDPLRIVDPAAEWQQDEKIQKLRETQLELVEHYTQQRAQQLGRIK